MLHTEYKYFDTKCTNNIIILGVCLSKINITKI